MKLKYKKVEGKFKTLSKTDLNNLKALKALGYTAEDFEHAYKIMIDSEWVKINKTDTVKHFLVNDNFSKYVNTVVSNESKLQPYG
jgi:Holliday junction resolvasome RuvABC DNA-binding subunit